MRFELTVLGTASQAPTRERGQGGVVLRWGDELVLFDPGEGCQRQLLLASISPVRIDRICITHFHGDHCLGLPGLLQSRALVTDRPIVVHYPASGEAFVDHLLGSSVIDFDLRLVRAPLDDGDVVVTANFELAAHGLLHTTPVLGYRLEAPADRHIVPARAEAAGVSGEAVAQLVEAGLVEIGGNAVRLEDVSEVRAGPVMAVVMDTAPCSGARVLAAGADLLLCESTYLSTEAALAREHGHMTAAQAGELAAEADAGLLVLTHFSGRHRDAEAFAAEARVEFPDVVAAHDLTCIAWTARSRPVS